MAIATKFKNIPYKRNKVTIDCNLVSRLVWAYRREIEECLNRIKTIKNLDQIVEKSPILTSVVFHPLYENLLVLEPLIECYLAGRDGKTIDTGFNIGDGKLYDLLNEIRKFVKEFPPKLDDFYKIYSAYNDDILARSPICEICKERGANHYFSNVKVHDTCLDKVDSKCCEYCGNLYLHDEQKCSNKSECSNYQLKEAKAANSQHGAITMRIPKEETDKIEREAKQGSTSYKEEK